MNFLREGGWFFLIPGFVAMFVAGFISDFPAIRDALIPVVYITLTFLSASIPLLIVHVFGVLNGVSVDLYRLIRRPSFFIVVLGFSIVWGFLFGVYYTNDRISTNLRALFGKDVVSVASHSELIRELISRAPEHRVGRRVWDGRPNDNGLRHNTNRVWMRVTFDDPKLGVFEGRPEKWFGGNTERQIYMSPACRTGREGQPKPVTGPGIWLNLENVFSIEFVDSSCSPCGTLHDRLVDVKNSKVCMYPEAMRN